jgi:simple sugar transport system permease protein
MSQEVESRSEDQLQPGPLGRAKLRIEKRPQASRVWELIAALIAVIAALAVSSVLIVAAGGDLSEALSAMAQGAVGGWNEVFETLIQATPLIFTGLAVTVAYRGKAVNIGAEGQLVAGAMGAFWVSANFSELPRPLLLLLIMLAAATGGGIWGGIAGYLKARFRADEIIVTVLLNYVIMFILSFLLSGLWRAPDTFFQQTILIPDAARFPILVPRSRLHAGLIVSLILAALVYVLLWRTRLGYEIRAMGLNPKAATYKGINVAKTVVVIMVISGAIAGLAGGIELVALHPRLRLHIASGLGFVGIMVAILGRRHPIGVILASLLFGALTTGASRMQIVTGIPVALVMAIQGMVFLFLVTAEVLSRYRLRRVADAV